MILLPAMYIRSESSVEVYDFELNKPVKADGVVSHVVVGAEFFLFEKENTLVTQIANGVSFITDFGSERSWENSIRTQQVDDLT